MIAQYADLQREAEESFNQRLYRRRRLLSGLRGFLLRGHSPKWQTARVLALAFLPGCAVTLLAVHFGLNPWGPAPALGVLVTWPAFIFLTENLSARLAREKNLLTGFESNIAHSYAELARENRPPDPGNSDVIDQGISSGIRSGIQSGGAQSGGGLIAALPVFIILALGTLGGWLVWQIIRLGPDLLSEAILDLHLAQTNPRLAEVTSLESWHKNAFTLTAIHFVILAVIALLLGATLLLFHQSYLPTR